MLSRGSAREELELGEGALFRLWHFIIRFVTPAMVLVVFIYNLL
ncbi:MAG: hypothetical protein R3310_10920 [Candidatus Competibacteraceae bacterium]|nr:hypothetical protein [Candidatus Competibacteraceae bacterium]